MDYSRADSSGFENPFADSESRNALFGGVGGGQGSLFGDEGGFGSPKQDLFPEPDKGIQDSGFGGEQHQEPLDDGHGYAPSIDEQFQQPSYANVSSPIQPEPHQPEAPQSPPATSEQHQSQSQEYTPARAAPQSPQQPRAQQQKRAKYYLDCKITALERTGRKDPSFRFDVHTNLPRFRTTQFRDVRRTHTEFAKLCEHLTASNPECLVPQLPPSSTAAGVGTEEDEIRVRRQMQRWLNYVTASEYLIQDEEFQFFVEGDSGYSPLVRRKPPATGVRRKVIKQFAPPPDDTPELFEARPIVKAFYLGAMETSHKVDKVVKCRRALGLAEADLGSKIHNLSLLENHSGMSNAYRKLGKTIQSVGDFHAAQATAEATTLGDPLQYHSQDAFIVKETLTNRHILIRELLQAQSSLQSKEGSVARMKASQSIKRDKVDEAIAALDEARETEHKLATKVHRVTTNLLKDKRKWYARTSHDMRDAIREYVIRQIEAERRTLATLEGVRPDIRAIDSSGGLSRLGRDAPPPMRRTGPTASQGPRGDAWSGVQRSGSLNRSALATGGASLLPRTEDPVNGDRLRDSIGKGLPGVAESTQEEDDRIDAKNAASRLATSTF